LQDPAVSVLDVGEGTSRCYAALKCWLRSAGTPIPENDVWIAALAVEHGLPLLTGDEHFAALPQVVRVAG
jgi:predicted nucleic acid-binding protein